MSPALSFSSSSYRVPENGGSATITVLRSNYTNSTVSVDFATANGTGQAGINYSRPTAPSSLPTARPPRPLGCCSRTTGSLDGDHTVLLSLGNVVGNAVVVNPSAATLTVTEADGSLIVPAGAALVSESGPVNGMIDPGETVTVLFGLRDSVGTNTANLVATLLATNGVTKPSGPANYGALVVRGPSVSRPFTFTASGTNGQTITATFQLQDGSANLGHVAFSFSLGKTAATYFNPATIVINDNTSATPYPSTISVSGLGGLVSRVTVTLTNFNHTWPSDVDVLLVSPPTPDSATGRKAMLMSKCGSSYTANNVTLTFDDAASNLLPHFSQLVSGTNQPTSFALATPPFPPALTPPGPYGTSLSALNGINPNGSWALYVIDDTAGNSGAISNGWVLNLTTSGVVPSSADVGLAMTVSPPPYVITATYLYPHGHQLRPFRPPPMSLSPIRSRRARVCVSTVASQGMVTTNSAGRLLWTVASLANQASPPSP